MTAESISSDGSSGMQPVRLAAWASLAVISGISAYYLYQHPIQVRSDVVAVADPMKQVQQLAQQQVQQQMQTATRDILVETRRLSAAVSTLNTDRDRLYGRLSTIEQTLDSVTGSLSRQATAVVPAAPALPATLSASQTVVDAGKGDSQLATSSNTLSSTSAADATVTRTSFGVDLGTAQNIDGLRTLWRKDSASSTVLASLQPVVAVRERPGVAGVNLRLIAGPLSDAAAAAKLCASLTAGAQRPCEPTVYDGQRLAMDVRPPVAPPRKPVPLRLPSAPKQPAGQPQILPR